MAELTDHDQVQRWAQDNDARPYAVVGDDGSVRSVVLRGPGISEGDVYGSETEPEEIDWQRFFGEFDVQAMALDTDTGRVVKRADAAA